MAKEPPQGIADLLTDADEALTRIGNAADSVESELAGDGFTESKTFRGIRRDVDHVVEIIADVTFAVEALDPKSQTWRVLLPCAEGIVYVNAVRDQVIVPWELAAMLTSGRVLAIRVEPDGPCLRFHLPRGACLLPESLVAALTGDTFAQGQTRADGATKSEGGA